MFLHFLLSSATDLAKVLNQAQASCPLFILLALLAARRSRPKFWLSQATSAAWLLLALFLSGPMYLLGNFLLIVDNINSLGLNWNLPGLLDPALLPYTTSLGLNLMATALAIYLTLGLSASQKEEVTAEKLLPATRFIFLIFLLLMFWSAQFCFAWPFAGLPEGLSLTDCFLAVAGHTWHNFFQSPLAGAMLLFLFWKQLQKKLETEANSTLDELFISQRAIALVGFSFGLPAVLNSLGTLSGYLLREEDWPRLLKAQLIQTAALSITLAILLALALKKMPRASHWLRRVALVAYFLAILSPSLLSLI
ncbi:MAG: hypothetical protein IJS50_02275 [Desulfovibrio sp.]|nr:hypothetical protein [Desulfovibrio sp.]